jgi:hypothetical protein
MVSMKNKRDAKRSSVKRQIPRRRRRHSSTAPRIKPFAPSASPRVRPDDVSLVPGRTTNIEGGKRLYWHIYHLKKRAGHVSIDCCEKQGNVTDASINVQLNQQSRSRGIGTEAFRRACELSGLHEVLASIRKSNVASQIAAKRAGFVALHDEPTGELLMIWKRL